MTGNNLFNRECSDCGNKGMKGVQVPAPNEPKDAYRCPVCSHIEIPGKDDAADMYVSKL